MWAGWFRLKSFAEGTKQEGTASTGTGSANVPGNRPADPTRGTAFPAPGQTGPGSAAARRAVADAGTAVGAYLVVWAWLGAAVLTDPVPWLLALAAGAAVITRAAGFRSAAETPFFHPRGPRHPRPGPASSPLCRRNGGGVDRRSRTKLSGGGPGHGRVPARCRGRTGGPVHGLCHGRGFTPGFG